MPTPDEVCLIGGPYIGAISHWALDNHTTKVARINSNRTLAQLCSGYLKLSISLVHVVLLQRNVSITEANKISIPQQRYNKQYTIRPTIFNYCICNYVLLPLSTCVHMSLISDNDTLFPWNNKTTRLPVKAHFYVRLISVRKTLLTSVGLIGN